MYGTGPPRQKEEREKEVLASILRSAQWYVFVDLESSNEALIRLRYRENVRMLNRAREFGAFFLGSSKVQTRDWCCCRVLTLSKFASVESIDMARLSGQTLNDGFRIAGNFRHLDLLEVGFSILPCRRWASPRPCCCLLPRRLPRPARPTRAAASTASAGTACATASHSGRARDAPP